MLVWPEAQTQPGLKPEVVPTFEIRARVRSVGGQQPDGREFVYRFGVPGPTVTSRGGEWSDWLAFDRPQVEATLKGSSCVLMRDFPIVLHLRVEGVVDPTLVEAELRFRENGMMVPLRGELFGPTLGILVWREGGAPRAGTMADYNQRYWRVLSSVQIPETQRPKKLVTVDRFIGGDDDRRDWREGIESLRRAGFSVIMLPPSRPIRDLLLRAGGRRTAWAVYNPPGYAFDFTGEVRPEAVAAWAREQAKPYRDAGYTPEQMALFAMSDEPGWYYPDMLAALVKSPSALARFRDYLRAQGLTPGEVGAASWTEVTPIGRSRARDLPSRRLFYWSMRFYPQDSARHFARCTRALEDAFYPGLPVITNWNFFSGRCYVPGPVANNTAKTSPDAAMGGHDWLEFGRLRGGTMLWTEDWFPDSLAYQWSFYCARLRAAASKSGVQYGGYVVPRASGDREEGIQQKILSVIGSGGKAVKYYVFGPEYNFPGNCYSERPEVLRKIAETQRMIGAAEPLLWPGRRPRAEVALLAPRSAQIWDAKEIPIPREIQDAANTSLNSSTVDYMAEVYDLYLALQHANFPVDLVDEDDLTAVGLKPYRVLYVTEPNVPVEGQREIANWVRAGGTLVTVTGAATRDRYDDPSTTLSSATGISERPRERLLVATLGSLPVAGKAHGALGDFTAIGARGTLTAAPGPLLLGANGGDRRSAPGWREAPGAYPKFLVEAAFEDGSPAIVRHAVGRGRIVHFAWLPGISYARSASGTKDRLPVGFSEAIRRWILYPTQLAAVGPPVTVGTPMVEAPVLLSAEGAAVTLLNWTGEPLPRLSLTVRLPFAARRVESVKRGNLPFRKTDEGVTFALALHAADIVMLRP